MKALRVGRLLSIFPVVTKRLVSSPALTLSVIVGLATAVALSAAIPMYSDAVHTRMLRRELGGGAAAYSVMYWYLGSNYKALDLEDIADVDRYIVERAPRLVGLPLRLSVRHMGTDNMRLFSAPGGRYEDKGDGLEWPALGFITGLADHVDVIEGAFPKATPAPEPIEVLALREFAEQLGLQVGERYALVGETVLEGRKQKVEFPVRIAGIWKAKDEADTFWFYRPSSFDKMLLVPEDVFVNRVASVYEEEVLRAVWYQVYDGTSVNIERVPQLQSAFRVIRTQVESRLPGASIAQSPEEAMDRYRLEAYHLMILLYVFSLPVISLVLLFVGLVSQMVVDRQKNEIALLRSRGTSRMQVFGIYAFEGVLTGVAAALIGLLTGHAVAAAIGRTESFLVFRAGPSLFVRVTQLSLALAVGALVLALAASLAPALAASRHTIVTYRRQTARFAGKPLWQRLFLDYALLVPVAYGYYMLSRRGTIGLAKSGETVGDPFQNPLLFLVPTLALVAAALIFLRLFPWLMENSRARERAPEGGVAAARIALPRPVLAPLHGTSPPADAHDRPGSLHRDHGSRPRPPPRRQLVLQDGRRLPAARDGRARGRGYDRGRGRRWLRQGFRAAPARRSERGGAPLGVHARLRLQERAGSRGGHPGRGVQGAGPLERPGRERTDRRDRQGHAARGDAPPPRLRPAGRTHGSSTRWGPTRPRSSSNSASSGRTSSRLATGSPSRCRSSASGSRCR